MTADMTLHQIGAVAERTGLSLRTIRHYGDVGLVVPSGRSEGGFRLYTDTDIAKLEEIKLVKPLGFSLEETTELLQLRREAQQRTIDAEGLDRLGCFADRAESQLVALGRRLDDARRLVEAVRKDHDSALGQ